MKKQNLIYEALLARCNADRMEALAILDVYMSNPVGIGEHPQITQEAMNALDKLSAAEGKLTELKKQYGAEGSSTKKLDLEDIANRLDEFLKIVTEGK